MIKLASSQPKWLAGFIILVVATLLIGGCAPNQLPVISNLSVNSEGEIDTGVSYQIECAASDPDEDELSYAWSADGGNISGEGSTINWTAPEAPGAYIITVQVTDGRDGKATTQLTVNVVAPNHPPTIENLVVTAEHSYLKEATVGYTTTEIAYKVLQGKAYQIECTASDPDGDELLFEWSADGGDISGESAVVTWTAPPQGGEVTVTVKVSDSRGGTATESIVFTVETCPCKLR
jgi:hypothetical protein